MRLPRGSPGNIRARWFDTLINADMYLKRSPAANGWQHSFRLESQRLKTNGGKQEIAVLLSTSAVTSVVLPYHVLDCLHAQYALIHANLYLGEGAEYDLVIFLRHSVLDDVLGPVPDQFSAPNFNGITAVSRRHTFAKSTEAAACPAEFPKSPSP
jgi:hypothetical protein